VPIVQLFLLPRFAANERDTHMKSEARAYIGVEKSCVLGVQPASSSRHLAERFADGVIEHLGVWLYAHDAFRRGRAHRDDLVNNKAQQHRSASDCKHRVANKRRDIVLLPASKTWELLCHGVGAERALGNEERSFGIKRSGRSWHHAGVQHAFGTALARDEERFASKRSDAGAEGSAFPDICVHTTGVSNSGSNVVMFEALLQAVHMTCLCELAIGIRVAIEEGIRVCDRAEARHDGRNGNDASAWCLHQGGLKLADKKEVAKEVLHREGVGDARVIGL